MRPLICLSLLLDGRGPWPETPWSKRPRSPPHPRGPSVRSPGSGDAQAAGRYSRPWKSPTTVPAHPSPSVRSDIGPTDQPDPIDAARSILGPTRDQVVEPSAPGTKAQLGYCLTHSPCWVTDESANRNALTGLLRGTERGINTRPSSGTHRSPRTHHGGSKQHRPVI